LTTALVKLSDLRNSALLAGGEVDGRVNAASLVIRRTDEGVLAVSSSQICISPIARERGGGEEGETHARFDKCPLYFNHFPAAEISSVVHLPLILNKHLKSSNSSLALGLANCSGVK
jgi:hypothetical protein